MAGCAIDALTQWTVAAPRDDADVAACEAGAAQLMALVSAAPSHTPLQALPGVQCAVLGAGGAGVVLRVTVLLPTPLTLPLPSTVPGQRAVPATVGCSAPPEGRSVQWAAEAGGGRAGGRKRRRATDAGAGRAPPPAHRAVRSVTLALKCGGVVGGAAPCPLRDSLLHEAATMTRLRAALAGSVTHATAARHLPWCGGTAVVPLQWVAARGGRGATSPAGAGDAWRPCASGETPPPGAPPVTLSCQVLLLQWAPPAMVPPLASDGGGGGGGLPGVPLHGVPLPTVHTLHDLVAAAMGDTQCRAAQALAVAPLPAAGPPHRRLADALPGAVAQVLSMLAGLAAVSGGTARHNDLKTDNVMLTVWPPGTPRYVRLSGGAPWVLDTAHVPRVLVVDWGMAAAAAVPGLALPDRGQPAPGPPPYTGWAAVPARSAWDGLVRSALMRPLYNASCDAAPTGDVVYFLSALAYSLEQRLRHLQAAGAASPLPGQGPWARTVLPAWLGERAPLGTRCEPLAVWTPGVSSPAGQGRWGSSSAAPKPSSTPAPAGSPWPSPEALSTAQSAGSVPRASPRASPTEAPATPWLCPPVTAGEGAARGGEPAWVSTRASRRRLPTYVALSSRAEGTGTVDEEAAVVDAATACVPSVRRPLALEVYPPPSLDLPWDALAALGVLAVWARSAAVDGGGCPPAAPAAAVAGQWAALSAAAATQRAADVATLDAWAAPCVRLQGLPAAERGARGTLAAPRLATALSRASSAGSAMSMDGGASAALASAPPPPPHTLLTPLPTQCSRGREGHSGAGVGAWSGGRSSSSASASGFSGAGSSGSSRVWSGAGSSGGSSRGTLRSRGGLSIELPSGNPGPLVPLTPLGSAGGLLWRGPGGSLPASSPPLSVCSSSESPARPVVQRVVPPTLGRLMRGLQAAVPWLAWDGAVTRSACGPAAAARLLAPRRGSDSTNGPTRGHSGPPARAPVPQWSCKGGHGPGGVGDLGGPGGRAPALPLLPVGAPLPDRCVALAVLVRESVGQVWPSSPPSTHEAPPLDDTALMDAALAAGAHDWTRLKGAVTLARRRAPAAADGVLAAGLRRTLAALVTGVTAEAVQEAVTAAEGVLATDARWEPGRAAAGAGATAAAPPRPALGHLADALGILLVKAWGGVTGAAMLRLAARYNVHSTVRGRPAPLPARALTALAGATCAPGTGLQADTVPQTCSVHMATPGPRGWQPPATLWSVDRPSLGAYLAVRAAATEQAPAARVPGACPCAVHVCWGHDVEMPVEEWL